MSTATWCRIPAILLAAALGCRGAALPPPPMQARNAAGGLASEEPSPDADVQADAEEIDGPSLELLRASRNGWVDYRLLTKDDFQARTSYVLWGNVVHAAEICTNLFPVRLDDATEAHAMMHPSCSFWNHRRKGTRRAAMAAAAAAGMLLFIDTLPDWYVLQHEQLHFAIMEVGARRYSRALAKLAPERRGAVATRLHELTLKQIRERNAQLDADTSGTFDQRAIEKWVRVLESELKELCGKGPECRVRTKDPQ